MPLVEQEMQRQKQRQVVQLVPRPLKYPFSRSSAAKMKEVTPPRSVLSVSRDHISKWFEVGRVGFPGGQEETGHIEHIQILENHSVE